MRRRPRIAFSGEADGVALGAAIRSRAFWILVAVLFFSSVSANGALTHLSALLTDRGVGAMQAAWTVSALGAASLTGRLMTGWFLDRFFAPRVAFCLLCAMTVGILLLSEAWTFAAGLRAFSTLYGVTWTFYAIAGAAGPVVLGRAFDVTGSYASLLLWLTLPTGAAALLLLWLPRYRVT